jgi:glucokinase
VLDPEVVVVAGGVAQVHHYWRALVTACAAEAPPRLADVPVRRSALGADAVVVGAAALAWSASRAAERP